MALSDEDKKEIQDMLKPLTEQISTGQKQIETNFDEKLNQLVGKTKDLILESSSQLSDKLKTEIDNELKAKFESLPNNNDENNPDDKKGDDEIDEKIQQLQKQINTQSSQYQELQKKYTDSEAARKNSEKEAHQQKLQTGFMSKVVDKVVDPENFFQTLVNRGMIFEDNGKYVTKTGKTNPDGTPEVQPAEKSIDQFLQGDLGYFQKARPGNGSGGSPGQQQENYQSTYFKEGSDNDASDIVAAMKSGKRDQVLKDLESKLN